MYVIRFFNFLGFRFCFILNNVIISSVLNTMSLSQEIADGVNKSAQAVQAAEAGIRQIGTLARQQTICKFNSVLRWFFPPAATKIIAVFQFPYQDWFMYDCLYDSAMIQERASLPIISMKPVVAGAAKKTSQAVGQATKSFMNMISRGEFSSENEDDYGIDRVEIW